MKKYIKPELFFESFELSQQIAACKFDLVEGSLTDDQCAFFGVDEEFTFGVYTKVFQSTLLCETYVDSYCYHNAAPEQIGIFNS